MEHLCAICAIERVMTTFMKPNLLKHIFLKPLNLSYQIDVN